MVTTPHCLSFRVVTVRVPLQDCALLLANVSAPPVPPKLRVELAVIERRLSDCDLPFNASVPPPRVNELELCRALFTPSTLRRDFSR